jgi:predicted amidohydrolase YtcJ
MPARALGFFAAFLFALPGPMAPLPAAAQEADLILTNGRVWTGAAERPWAQEVAVRGDRILLVGENGVAEAHRTARTRVVDLGGRLVTPGFIDNHTHFDQAGALLLGVKLLDVAEPRAFARRVREARDRLPAGAWITGGDWGAYEDWQMGAAGTRAGQRARLRRFRPTRALIDSVTPATPVLLSRWDRSEHLANAVALERAGLSCARPVEGLECERGRATGIVADEALRRVRGSIPPKPFEQRLMEARVALAQLREFGVTGIHDITPPEQLPVFHELHRSGELTTRVYARPTLDRWEPLAAAGIAHGFGNDYVRIGGLKGFVDGIMGASTAQFYEPFLHTGGFGVWRDMMRHPAGMQGLIDGAVGAGHWPQIHAIGDRAIDTLLTMYERTLQQQGAAAGGGVRLRVIHAQHLRGPEVAERMARLGVVAEVQPYHAIDDMRWMGERIGQERLRWTYAFRTLHDAGVRLSFGSDWPGTHASWYPADPLQGIYAAVTRQTLDGQPESGWFPEERVDVETALRAYTINNAWAAGEEELKGSIAPGKLADLAVLDRDLFRIPAREIKDVRVVMTVLGGRIVHEAAGR